MSSWENIFSNFVETGNLTTPYILMNDKSDTLKKLKIKDKKIILFSDAAIGMNGIQSSKGFVEYIKFICRLQMKMINVIIYLKLSQQLITYIQL